MSKYPNQKTLTIVKPSVKAPFLQIYQEDLLEAFKRLTRSAFGVYCYLATNANGFQFDYSPQAIENTGMMFKGTATKVRVELEEQGYIEDGKFYVESWQKRHGLEKIREEIQKITGQSR